MSRLLGDLRFRPATDFDAYFLARNLRDADHLEVKAAHGNIYESVLLAMQITPMKIAVECDAGLVCVFGFTPLKKPPGSCSPWLLATPLLARYPGALTRAARTYLPRMLELYPYMVNYVDARNELAWRWLQRMGFAVHEPKPYGVSRMPFRKIEMRV